jgi:hypothetical protein
MEKKPFIPRDKPRSWVVFMLSALLGLAFGLCAFAAASCGWPIAKAIFIAGFAVCWAVAALAGVTCGIGMATGRYGNLREEPWRERQVRKNS